VLIFFVPTAYQVDIPRYMGKWYQIAANETSFNQGLVAVTAEYTLKDDGTVDVYNRARKNSFDGEVDEIRGIARVVDPVSRSKLNVEFPGIFNFPVIGGNYWIMVLDDIDYSYAAVADPLGITLFILSRTPKMDEELYQNILSELETKRVNTAKLIRTPQPESE
jgi:apolipoprotein D and lipocalin family protein